VIGWFMLSGSWTNRERRRTLLLTLGGALVALYVLAPFSWLVLTSFMHERDALSVPPQWIPRDLTIENYGAFFAPSGTRAIVGSRAAEETLPGMANSLIAAAGTAILNLILGTLAAYSLARLRFRGRVGLLFLYLGSRMVPGIITYLTFTLPFTIWLLKSYFQGIPPSLEEAALIDGCTWPQMLCKVLLPVAMPGLVAAAMFAFMTAWSDYLFAVILTSTMAAKTLPVVVAGFATDVTTERTLMAAGGVLAAVPPLVLAFILQSLIVQGLTAGSVKE